MLPVKLTLKGIGPYEEETVDFRLINGDLVAIVGENGSGKTFLIDSVFAALYRYFPTRDSVFKYCRGKAQIILDFIVGGYLYQSVLNIDSKKREIEPWLFKNHDQGLEHLTDGKNSTFDKAVEELCGSPELILTSSFSAQNRKGSFYSLPKAKRKELFIEMVGLSKLQVVSDESAIREKAAKESYDLLSNKAETYRLASEKKDIDLDALYRKLDAARDEVSVAETDIGLADSEVNSLKVKVQSVKDIEVRQFPIHKRRQTALRDIAETDRAVADSERMAASVDNLRELASGYTTIEAELSRLRAEQGVAYAAKTNHYRQLEDHTKATKDLELQKRVAQEIVSKTGLQLNRAGADAAIISTVPCRGLGECAGCQFLVNAIKAQDDIPDLEAGIDNATATVLHLDGELKAMKRPDAEKLSGINIMIDSFTTKIKDLEPQFETANNARNKLVTAEAAADNVQAMRARRERLDQDLASAEAELVELDAELAKAKGSDAALKAAITKRFTIQEILDGAKAHLNTMVASVSKAEAEKNLAMKANAELEKLIPQLAKLDQDRKSWNLLAKAFGKTGIQSLEIDAAGPAVSDIANDLLFSCFGPRFSVRFVTQVLKDDKSGYKDDFDIYVTDSERGGAECSIDDLSGGERVIVCEAVSLAICLFNADRGQLSWRSLWRDEASGALDKKREPMYISMLRRARELGHFEKLYFIAHNERVSETADSRINVVSGHVTFG